MYTTAAKVRELIPQASADNPDTTAIEAQISRAEATHVDPYLRKVWDVPFTSPDDIVVEMMAKAITGSDSDAGLLLDGFPRTVAQAEALDAQLDKADKPLDAVVVIVADADAIVERITGRRSCSKCGKAYHVRFLPSRAEGACDDCAADLIQREDDTEDVVRRRLAAYNAETEPVIAYYRGRDGLDVIDIDGSKGPDEVTVSTVSALEVLMAAR